MTHVVVSKSRSWALEFCLEVVGELVCVMIEWVVDYWGGMHLEHQWKVCQLTI